MTQDIPRRSIRRVFFALLLSISASRGWAVEHNKGQGEPSALAGKRLVFTNWIYVRTGQLDWVDDKGKSIFQSGSLKAGPMDAHFNPIMTPYGVRLSTEAAQHPALHDRGPRARGSRRRVVGTRWEGCPHNHDAVGRDCRGGPRARDSRTAFRQHRPRYQ